MQELFPEFKPQPYVIGACLGSPTNKEFYQAINRGVLPEMFEGVHRGIWEVCLEALDRNLEINFDVVIDLCKNKPPPEQAPLLLELIDLRCDCRTQNILYWVEQLHEEYQNRWLEENLGDIVNSRQRSKLVMDFAEKFRKIQSQGEDDHSFPAIAELVAEEQAEILKGKPPAAITTGFESIDSNMTIEDGSLTVIAARPSGGKTTFMCNITINALAFGKRIAYFTFETSAPKVLRRMTCIKANISGKAYRQNQLTQQQIEIFNDCLADLSKSNENQLVKFDGSLNHIKAMARQGKQEHNLDAILVDYLGLVKAKHKNFRSPYEEVTYVVEELKSLALELDIPVILACQLRRAQKGQEHTPPTEADLRDSGQIEAAADNVIVLHVPHHGGEPVHDSRQIFLRKNREGPKDISFFANANLETGRLWE